jgi:hypothetical protein
MDFEGQDSGVRGLQVGFRLYGLEFRDLGFKLWVESFGFRVQDLGFRLLGFKV